MAKKSTTAWACIAGEYKYSMLEPKTTHKGTFQTQEEAHTYICRWAESVAWENGTTIANAESHGLHFTINHLSASVYDEDTMSFEFCVAHPINATELFG